MSMTFDRLVESVMLKYGLTQYKATEAVNARLEQMAGKKIAWEDRDIWVDRLWKKSAEEYKKEYGDA